MIIGNDANNKILNPIGVILFFSYNFQNHHTEVCFYIEKSKNNISPSFELLTFIDIHFSGDQFFSEFFLNHLMEEN